MTIPMICGIDPDGRSFEVRQTVATSDTEADVKRFKMDLLLKGVSHNEYARAMSLIGEPVPAWSSKPPTPPPPSAPPASGTMTRGG